MCVFLSHPRTKYRMRYCSGDKISISVRLLARLLGLERASFKNGGLLSNFALCLDWINSTLQLLNSKSGYGIELEMQNIFQLCCYLRLNLPNSNKIEVSKHLNLRFSGQQSWNCTKHLKIGMTLQPNPSSHHDCGIGSWQLFKWR